MKNIWKIVGVTGAFALVVGGLTGTVSAESPRQVACPNEGPIISGLWQGVGLATGTQYPCSPATAPSSLSQNPSPAVPRTNGSRPSADVVDGVRYVALGDSVAAGLGLPLQSGGNQACKVSYQAYPAYVASALGVPYSNVACSGATAGDLVTEQHLSGTSADISPQLDAAFASGTPSFMTLTAGANDMYWQYFVRKCYSGTCGTPTDQATATQLIRAMQLKLSYAFQSIARRSNGATPTVIITGYYRPFAVNCPPQSAITASEMQWLNAQTDALNYALATTASNYSFVRFVPINFNGHELCSEDPWIQDQNDSAPAHPTAQGQRAIAQAVLGSIQQPARRSGY